MLFRSKKKSGDSKSKNEIEALENYIKKIKIEHNSEKEMLESQLNTMSLAIVEERKKIEKFEKDAELVEGIKKNIDSLKKENLSLKEQLEKKLEEIKEGKKEIDEKNEKLTKLENNIQSLKEKNITLEESVEKYELNIKNLEEQLKTINDKLTAQDEKVKNKESDINNIKDGLTIKENAIKELEESLNASKTEVDKLKQDIKTLNNNTMNRENTEISTLKLKLEHSEKINNMKIEQIKNLNAEIEKLKANTISLSTELVKIKEEQKMNYSKFENITKLSEELHLAKKTIEDLKEKNKSLQIISDEKSVSTELIESMQKQREALLKENSNLKAALFEAENPTKGKAIHDNKESESKSTKVIEEIQQILAEVIYSYKTMSTNGKEFLDFFIQKKDQAEEYISIVQKLQKVKKVSEQSELIESLKDDVTFLKGFPSKSDYNKIIINCLKEVADKKSEKLLEYGDEIGKYKSMIQISSNKVAEYEDRLTYYC